MALPDDLTERVDRAAAEFMQTRSSLVRMILSGWLVNFEHAGARDALAHIEESQTDAH